TCFNPRQPRSSSRTQRILVSFSPLDHTPPPPAPAPPPPHPHAPPHAHAHAHAHANLLLAATRHICLLQAALQQSQLIRHVDHLREREGEGGGGGERVGEREVRG